MQYGKLADVRCKGRVLVEINNEIAAIVTGGASGLGEAVVRSLAARGARVTVFDLDADKGTKLASECGGLFVPVDVGDPHSVGNGLKAARTAHGPERVLVTCAGIAPAERTVTKTGPHDFKTFERTLRVNLTGVFNCATQAAANMAALPPVTSDGERGVIINTASIAAYEGQIGQIAYAASKAGVAGMTLPMARDLAAFWTFAFQWVGFKFSKEFAPTLSFAATVAALVIGTNLSLRKNNESLEPVNFRSLY